MDAMGDSWKTILSFWEPLTFQGRTVKLRGSGWQKLQPDMVKAIGETIVKLMVKPWNIKQKYYMKSSYFEL